MKAEQSIKRKRVVVIGGGISGLAAAHRLAERSAAEDLGLEVVLLEAGARLGGTIRTYEREGFLLEGGPDAFISEKPEAVELARRIGLTEQLLETNSAHRRSFIARRSQLNPVPEGFHLLAPARLLPFLGSQIISWPGKARMALDLILPRRKADTNGADDESLADFVRRRLGSEALERLAQPMVGGIYTADPERLSLRATMPRFLEMERAHRSLIMAMRRAGRARQEDETRGTSGARYSLFLSFRRGMQTLTDTLAARLPAGSARLGARVSSLAFDAEASEWIINLDADESLRAPESIRAAAVCVALPAHGAARLLGATDAALAAELEAIPYASTATINLAYRRADIPHPLDGFGFIVPFIEGRATLACSFSSVKFKGRAPAGYALLRAFVGGALQPEKFALDEDEMLAAVRRDLRDLLGIEKPPLFHQVAKWPRSMPQYHLGHLERAARIRARLKQLPSLRLAGNAYGGAGIPDCIRSGEQAANEIISVTGNR